jgi:hypothetical protein
MRTRTFGLDFDTIAYAKRIKDGSGTSLLPEKLKEINKFVKKIIKQGKEIGLHFKYVVNNKEHQKHNTECGMYSLFMIINLLKETRTPEDFLTTLFTDKEMERFRSIFFNHEEV